MEYISNHLCLSIMIYIQIIIISGNKVNLNILLLRKTLLMNLLVKQDKQYIKVKNNIILIHNKVSEIQKIQILILKNNCINQNIIYGINNFLMDKQQTLENGHIIILKFIGINQQEK